MIFDACLKNQDKDHDVLLHGSKTQVKKHCHNVACIKNPG